VGRVGPDGIYRGECDTFGLSGYVRAKGESDLAITELVKQRDAQQGAM